MTEKNEALRLAVLSSFRGGLTLGEVQEAEDELNRLIAQRDALLEALRLIAGLISHPEARQKALDAIAKVEENT